MLTLVATISGEDVTTTYSTMSALKSYVASKRITAAVLSGKSESTTDTMYSLFASSLSYLTSLDLSGLDFSNITNTGSMLSGCNRLTSLTFPTDIDTSKVTNMSYMFSKCTKLTTIDVSKFNTSNVTSMSYMFNDCNLITALDLSNFDTSKVTDMSYMFKNCYALQIDISNLDTSKVINMNYMFDNCNGLTSFNATNLNLSSVTNMSYMFSNCTSLTSIDLSKLEAPKVTNISYIFNNCKVMTSAKLFKTTNTLTNISGLFALCYALKEFDITQLNTDNVTSMSSMFSYCRGLASLDLYYLNTQNVTNMHAMFQECNGISSLDISRFKTSKVTDTSYMFYRCYNLTEIDIQSLDLSNVTNTSYMFNSCIKLATIYSNDFDTSKITNSTAMFTNSTKLKNYDSTKVDAQYANIETGYFTYQPSYTIPFISNIDMNTNEIKNQVVHNLKHAPENPIKGQIYFDTLTNKLYYFDGTNWTTTGVQKEITGDTLPIGSIVKFDGDTIPANWEEVAGGEIIDNLNSTSAIDALSANQGRILNEKINDLEPLLISVDGTKGICIYLPNADFYQMLTFEITGNGYGTSMPFSTHIQGYHFENLGDFYQCKQQNTSGTLPQCKFMIKNNKIALWIPNPGLYTSLVIKCYRIYGNIRKQLQLTYEFFDSEPDADAKTVCTLGAIPPVPTSSVNNVDANNYTTFGQYYLGTGCSNLPENKSWVQLLVLGNRGDCTQIATVISVGNPIVYLRNKSGTTWGEWKQLSNFGSETIVNGSANTAQLYTTSISNLVIGGIYEVAMSYNHNTNGSLDYRSVIYGILSLPVGYDSSNVVVKPKFNIIANYWNNDITTDSNVAVVCEGGAATIKSATFKTNPKVYIYSTNSSYRNAPNVSVRKIVG